EEVCKFAPTRELIVRMMAEAEAVAKALGVQFKISIEKRIAGAEAIGAHKPSTLQDVELGRPLELDALVGAVIELGDLLKVATPNIKAIYACVCLLAQILNAQHGKLRITS